LDGLDVFIVGDLKQIMEQIEDQTVLYGSHSLFQRYICKNTCNKNVGILIGKSKNILNISECFVNASQYTRDFFKDCDQSYFNYILNNTSELKHLNFKSSDLIYMNSDEINLKSSVLYHAIGMNDFYLFKTKKNLKNLHINIETSFKPKRYFSYIKKWLEIEMKILFKLF